LTVLSDNSDVIVGNGSRVRAIGLYMFQLRGLW